MSIKLKKKGKKMFKPIGKRILVKRIEEANTTLSGIIIPDDAKEKPNKGIVVSISSEILEVGVDDLIVFSKYSGSEITLDGIKHIVLNIEDVLGVY